MIEVESLSRSFVDKKRGVVNAVNQVSFTVAAGEIFGLLGPNGAGKSTCLRILATLLSPTGGRASVNGFDVQSEAPRVRESIGFLSGDMGPLSAHDAARTDAVLWTSVAGDRGRNSSAAAKT